MIWAAAVIKGKITAYPSADLRHAGIGPQLGFLGFDAQSGALDLEIMPPCALIIHTDLDLASGQHLLDNQVLLCCQLYWFERYEPSKRLFNPIGRSNFC